MHSETNDEVRFSEMQRKLAERAALPAELRRPAFINWKPRWTMLDPRGTYEQREEARIALNRFDEAMQRQDPDFVQHKRQVVRYCRPIIRTLKFTDWVSFVQGAWTRALKGELPYFRDGIYHEVPKQTQETDAWRARLGITGNNAQSVIIDDPINQTDKQLRKAMKPIKVPKPPKKDYNTVGVRFLRGHNLQKVYTYKVAKKAKLRLGEEIVVPSTFEGMTTNGIAIVVDLHSTPQDIAYGIEYKFVTGRVAPL